MNNLGERVEKLSSCRSLAARGMRKYVAEGKGR